MDATKPSLSQLLTFILLTRKHSSPKKVERDCVRKYEENTLQISSRKFHVHDVVGIARPTY